MKTPKEKAAELIDKFTYWKIESEITKDMIVRRLSDGGQSIMMNENFSFSKLFTGSSIIFFNKKAFWELFATSVSSPDRSALAGMMLKFSILVFFIHSKKVLVGDGCYGYSFFFDLNSFFSF